MKQLKLQLSNYFSVKRRCVCVKNWLWNACNAFFFFFIIISIDHREKALRACVLCGRCARFFYTNLIDFHASLSSISYTMGFGFGPLFPHQTVTMSMFRLLYTHILSHISHRTTPHICACISPAVPDDCNNEASKR